MVPHFSLCKMKRYTAWLKRFLIRNPKHPLSHLQYHLSVNNCQHNWTMDEEQMFVEGFELHGKNWKEVATFMKTKD